MFVGLEDVQWHNGYSYAQLFASRGANVVVNDVSKEAADKVVDAILKGAFRRVARKCGC